MKLYKILSKLSIRRVINLVKIYSSYYFTILSGKVYHAGMPFSVSIEPTTFCNLQCKECPSGLRKFTRPTGNLSYELFKKAIDELNENLIYLILYFQGEPLMNKNFIDFVKYAVSKKIYTTTSTNAHFLTDELSKQIVESGLDSIIISMDGTTQEAYESYRKGGDLNKVKEGITNLVSWKQKLKSSNPYIILQFLVLKTNEHQIDEIKHFTKQQGIDELQLKTVQVYDFENGNTLIPENIKYSRYLKQTDGKYRLKKKLTNHCFRMWSSCVITWDGDVLPCCFDKDANYKNGNITKHDFRLIWKSSNYNSFRKKVFKNRKSIDICCNCTE